MGAEFSSQGWNRYSYVGNNPLATTDPTGMCFFGCFFKSIFHGIGSIFRAIARVPVVGQALAAVGGTALCDGNPQCGIAAVAALNSAEAGVTSGRLGDALKAGLIIYGEAEAFNAVGNVTEGHYGFDKSAGSYGFGHYDAAGAFVKTASAADYFGSANFFENVAGHALVGGLGSVASGGTFQAGAFSAGLGSAAAPGTAQLGFAGGLVAESVIGGVGSVAGGGKFLNGASTAGFGYLFSGAASGNRGDNTGQDGQGPSFFGQFAQGLNSIGNQVQASYDYVFGAGGTTAAFLTLNNSGPSIVTCYPSGCIDQNGALVNVGNQFAGLRLPSCVSSLIRACGAALGIAMGHEAIGVKPPPYPVTPPPYIEEAPVRKPGYDDGK